MYEHNRSIFLCVACRVALVGKYNDSDDDFLSTRVENYDHCWQTRVVGGREDSSSVYLPQQVVHCSVV